jgi:hypothetical protein
MLHQNEDLSKRRATETVPGIRYLRELWDIPRDASSKKEPLQEKVSTDIYNTGTGTIIPRRKISHH